MSGGSNPLKRAFGGDGMAWRREQEDVLAHAKQLGYDRDGGSIISPTDNKQDWESWRNGFVNWKNKNVALEKEGKAFWQRSSGGGDGGGESASSPIEIGPSPMQERAASNIYFPMLVPEYSSPQALDYSAYMPSDSPFGGMGGLLYQPGTQQYQEAFPMDMNILRYQPPQLLLPQVTYSNPIQGFSIPVMGEESTDRNGRPQKPTNDPSNDQRGGRSGANPMDWDYSDLSPAQIAQINNMVEQTNLSYDDLGNVEGGSKGQGNTPGKSDNPADASSAGGAGFSFN